MVMGGRGEDKTKGKHSPFTTISHGISLGFAPERPQIPRCILFQHDIALIQQALDRPPMAKSVCKWFLPIEYLQQQIEVLSFQVPILPSSSGLLSLWAKRIFLSKQFDAICLHSCIFLYNFSAKRTSHPIPPWEYQTFQVSSLHATHLQLL